MEEKKKIMMIVWKWDELTHVNENILTKKEFEDFAQDIGKDDVVKKRFYQEYAVEASELCPSASVVAASIYKVNEDTKALLYALIDTYAKPENELIILLHRANKYEDGDVDALLNHFNDRVSKCFLFADGRDFIYHKTQKSGILDDIGNFFIGFDKDGQKIATFDNGMVKQPYFDRVWEYYQHEFETKVFKLKEELLEQWFKHLLPGQPDAISRNLLVDAIKETNTKALYFRLKSFNGLYDKLKALDFEKDFELYNELETEKKAIENLEKERGESYIFDDCIKNIQHHRNNNRNFVADAYDAVKQSLDDILFKPQKAKTVTKAQLLKLAGQFNYLVKVIPGELD